MNRLHPSRLETLPADVARPRYDRARLEPGIVHLGLGAFARAHLAVVNDAALAAGNDLRWGIVGVSLRYADTRDALAPQAGLYTVATRDAAADGSEREVLQVVGCVLDVLVAPHSPRAVLEHIADPRTRIVSLSVTEPGYHRAPGSATLNLDDPAIAHDLADAAAPRTAIGFIVHGLQLRRRDALAPLTLLSCDNLPAAGDTLRALVLGFAAQLDAGLHDWIAAHCTFPNAMVDRIVPRTRDADREHIAARLGVDDAGPVVTEPFLDWAIEDRFANGRPAWERGGARWVERAEPFERMKLRMVNGSHSTLAYLAEVAGWGRVDVAMRVRPLAHFLECLMQAEVAPTLQAPPGIDLDAYRERLLRRFANPALQHATRQIAMDGSQKLPQRLLDTVRDRLAAHASVDRLALAVAGWLHYLRGPDETGAAFEIRDPLAAALAEQVARAEALGSVHDGVTLLTRYAPVFGALGSEPRFVSGVARHALSLRQRGVLATLESQP